MHDLRCILSVHIAKVFLGEFMKQTTITSFYCKSHCPLAEFIIHDSAFARMHRERKFMIVMYCNKLD